MRLSELQYEFIRTPLERPLLSLRHALTWPERRRHPELAEIHVEPQRIRAAVGLSLRRESHCIDVGCHYGSMLSLFCREAPAGRHVAFEPMPQKVRFLRRKFPEVQIFDHALWDRAGQFRFYTSRASGFSSMAPVDHDAGGEMEVVCRPLDEVVPLDRRFELLKLDVEGAELNVLRGSLDLLRRDRPLVIFEHGPGSAPAFGNHPAAIFDFLRGEPAYEILHLRDFLGARRPIDRESFLRALEYPFQAFNWVAVPRDRLERVQAVP